jgi:DNA-binding transcriptional LysR family regulator
MIDDIRYLIVFAKIVQAGSISGGAEALGLTTATASTHLSKLEKILAARCSTEIPASSP